MKHAATLIKKPLWILGLLVACVLALVAETTDSNPDGLIDAVDSARLALASSPASPDARTAFTQACDALAKDSFWLPVTTMTVNLLFYDFKTPYWKAAVRSSNPMIPWEGVVNLSLADDEDPFPLQQAMDIANRRGNLQAALKYRLVWKDADQFLCQVQSVKVSIRAKSQGNAAEIDLGSFPVGGSWQFSASTRTQPVAASANIKMVKITGGRFLMGSPTTELNRGTDEVLHRVRLSDFYMSATEVTQSLYEKVMGKNPSRFLGADLPVDQVGWYEALAFCNELSKKEGRDPAYTIKGHTISQNYLSNGYQLPTEAQWEYACRAGSTTAFNTGNNIRTDQANYNGKFPYQGAARGQYRESTMPVGSFAPNAWGLYDMHGNVAEWCYDYYVEYWDSGKLDPIGLSNGMPGMVVRGGTWYDGGTLLRSAARSRQYPDLTIDGIGIRVICPK